MTWSNILAALRSGAWVGWLGTAVTAAVSFGFLDANQAGAVGNAVSAAATLVAAIIAVTHTLHAAKLIAQPNAVPPTPQIRQSPVRSYETLTNPDGGPDYPQVKSTLPTRPFESGDRP